MSAWYRHGSAAVENGSATVEGTSTAWLAQAKPGDAITFDDGATWREIAAVVSNTELTLSAAYDGATASGVAYAINHTSLDWKTSSLLFAAAAELLARFTHGWITFGINDTPDASNRLAVAAEASRFAPDPDGSGSHVQRILKATAGADAVTQYEAGATAHARAGLIGTNGYRVQVSPDGVSWVTAMLVDPATGAVTFPSLGGGAIYTIRDTLASVEDLPAEGAAADAYLIDNELWVWLPDAGEAGEWHNAGALSDGPPGPQGPTAPNGGAVFDFDAGTTDADPGEGKLRLNNAALASVTAAYISDANKAGASVLGYLNAFDDRGAAADRGHVRISDNAAPTTNFAYYRVTGTVGDGTTYRKLTAMEHLASGGTLDGKELSLEFAPAGSTGAAGAGIVSGALVLDEQTTPATPSAGQLKVFAKADKRTYTLDSAGLERPLGGVDGKLELEAIATPTPPAAGSHQLYFKSDGRPYTQNSAGTERQLGAYPPNFLTGFTLANDTTDATNDLAIAAGACRDKTNAQNIDGSAMIKQLDAGWAAGTNQGFRYSGAAIANATYHVFSVCKAGGADPDYYADPSPDNATALGHLQAETGGADYVYARRIGSILRESGAIVPFVQDGDRFDLSVPVNAWSLANPGTSAVTVTLAVPLGISVLAIVIANVGSTGTTSSQLLITSLAQADTAPSAGVFTTRVRGTASVNGDSSATALVQTNTSGQIRRRNSVSDAAISTIGILMGWLDRRGQDGGV